MRKFVLILLLFLPLSLSASDYRQIETIHTTIIFEEPDQVYAQEIASFADEVYENLASYLSYEGKEKVPVVLAGKTAFANGYYAPFPASIYLYITSPDNRFLGSRTVSWLRSLYTHELTHYLHLNAKVGPAKVLDFLGPGVRAFSTVFMPGWWIEGITTHTETKFAEGGRGDSLSFALTYQVPVTEDSIWSLAQGAYNGPFAPSGRIYVTGYLMVDYLIKTYGVEAFNTINKKFAAFPFFGLSPAFRKVTGYSAKEIFTFALEEHASSEDPVQGTMISRKGQGNSYLPSSVDLGVVGLRESPYDGSAIYRYREGEAPEKLMAVPVSGRSSIAFSDEKALLAVASSDPTDPSSISLAMVSYSDLYLLDLEEGKSRPLWVQSRLVHPALSMDGKRAVASFINGPYYDLVEVDLADGTIEPLYAEERVSLLEPSLSYDGSQILFLALEEGNSSIKLLDQDNKVQTLVGPTHDELRAPRFTQDGSILFVGEHEGLYSVYRIEKGEGRIRKIHTDPNGVFSAGIIDDLLVYETYTTEGIALKSVSLEKMKNEPAQFSEQAIHEDEESIDNKYEVAPYKDRLKHNLFLPFPFVEGNNIQPGIYFHATSNLRRKSLIGSVGYSLQGMRPIATATYQWAGGNYSLQVAGDINTYDNSDGRYLSTLSSTIAVPLYYHAGYDTIVQYSIQPSISLTTDYTAWAGGATLTVGGTVIDKDYRSIDLYGPERSDAALGLQVLVNGDFSSQQYALYGSFSHQKRLFEGRHMVRLSVAGIAGSDGVGTSYPLFSFTPTKDGDAKMRLSASYLLPLGLFDQPLLYGGVTKAGLELTLQTAWYLSEQTLLWEDAWALGATLTGNYVQGGASFSFQPFIRISYLFGPSDWRITIGLDGKGILDLLPTPLDRAPRL
ncbi:MAG: TolB family protein [Sphaerochaeta sp.]